MSDEHLRSVSGCQIQRFFFVVIQAKVRTGLRGLKVGTCCIEVCERGVIFCKQRWTPSSTTFASLTRTYDSSTRTSTGRRMVSAKSTELFSRSSLSDHSSYVCSRAQSWVWQLTALMLIAVSDILLTNIWQIRRLLLHETYMLVMCISMSA